MLVSHYVKLSFLDLKSEWHLIAWFEVARSHGIIPEMMPSSNSVELTQLILMR